MLNMQQQNQINDNSTNQVRTAYCVKCLKGRESNTKLECKNSGETVRVYKYINVSLECDFYRCR
jgi:hypothetical protein